MLRALRDALLGPPPACPGCGGVLPHPPKRPAPLLPGRRPPGDVLACPACAGRWRRDAAGDLVADDAGPRIRTDEVARASIAAAHARFPVAPLGRWRTHHDPWKGAGYDAAHLLDATLEVRPDGGGALYGESRLFGEVCTPFRWRPAGTRRISVARQDALGADVGGAWVEVPFGFFLLEASELLHLHQPGAVGHDGVPVFWLAGAPLVPLTEAPRPPLDR